MNTNTNYYLTHNINYVHHEVLVSNRPTEYTYHPMTKAEKDDIREWIRAGCPDEKEWNKTHPIPNH